MRTALWLIAVSIVEHGKVNFPSNVAWFYIVMLILFISMDIYEIKAKK